jgi:hypothetical protein
MQVVEDIMPETKKNLDVSVGNVIAGTKEEIKKQKQRERNKRWYQKNGAAYRLKNKEKIKKRQRDSFKKRYKTDLEYRKKLIEKHKKWTIENREHHLEYQKKYQKRRTLEQNKKHYEAKKRRLKNNPSYKLSVNIRRRILLALKGTTKSKSTLNLLGCSVSELWQHLESKFQPGMTKENHGVWHIDHIKPCASFDLTKPEEQEKCFHYTNLQPLWAKDNLSKGAKWEE